MCFRLRKHYTNLAVSRGTCGSSTLSEFSSSVCLSGWSVWTPSSCPVLGLADASSLLSFKADHRLGEWEPKSPSPTRYSSRYMTSSLSKLPRLQLIRSSMLPKLWGNKDWLILFSQTWAQSLSVKWVTLHWSVWNGWVCQLTSMKYLSYLYVHFVIYIYIFFIYNLLDIHTN